MRPATLAILASLAAGLGAPLPAAAQEPLAPETVGNVAIAPGTRMLFSVDLALDHAVDGRLHVYDAGSMAYLGIIATSMFGMVNAPDGDPNIYVATSHLSRTNRGERTDVLEIYSGKDLAFVEEIPISTARAQALNYRSLFQPSSDRRYFFIQNATPATSVTIVDLQGKAQIGEIPNPGCYGIFPAFGTATRFATTCGDGTFGTVDVAADGTGAMKPSAVLFDPDADALFSSADDWNGKWVFPSYAGNLHVVDVEGETASVSGKIALSAGVDGNWRPGGYQPLAVHQASNMAYVLMHSNGAEGSHKNPAEEIWAVDLATGKVAGRTPSVPGIALAVSQGEAPALFVTDGLKGEVVKYPLPAAGSPFALTAAGSVPGGSLPDQVEVR